MTLTAPDIVRKPKLALFIFERDLTLHAVGEAIGCSHEHVRRLCLPFGDPRRRVPDDALMKEIVRWTNGQIGPADFYDLETA